MNRRVVFFRCTANLPLTKKSKNSRMGSGKGALLRWAIKLVKNSIVLVTNNIPTIILLRVVKLWNKTIPFKVKVI